MKSFSADILNQSYNRSLIKMFIGSLICFLILNSHSLVWCDEICSLLLTDMPFKDMMKELLTGDVHPPVYFIALKFWRELFGSSVFVARVFSYLGILACAFGSGMLVKKYFNETVALWYTALWLFAPHSFWLTATIRMYSWGCFFIISAFMMGQIALRDDTKKDWRGYFLYSLLAVYTHHYAMVICCFIACLFLYLSFKKSKKAFKECLIVNLILLLCVLPSVYLALKQETTIMWIKEKDIFEALIIFISADVSIIYLNHIITFFLSANWTVGFQFLATKEIENQKKEIMFQILLLIASFLLFGIILTFAYRPLFVFRYEYLLMGCIYVFFAVGISETVSNRRLFKIFLSITFFISFCGNGWRAFISTQNDFFEAVKKIVKEDDLIITDSFDHRMFLYYFMPDYDIRLKESERGTLTSVFMERKNTYISTDELTKYNETKPVFFITYTPIDKYTLLSFRDDYSRQFFTIKKYEPKVIKSYQKSINKDNK